VHKDGFTLQNPNIGPTTFGLNTIVKHSKVASSEPSYETSAELYLRVRAVGVGGVRTSWANSQNEVVQYVEVL
jgi:hypothetical protein